MLVYEDLILLERQGRDEKSWSPELFVIVVCWKNGSFLNFFSELIKGYVFGKGVKSAMVVSLKYVLCFPTSLKEYLPHLLGLVV